MNLVRFNKPVYRYNDVDTVFNHLFNDFKNESSVKSSCSPAVNVLENEEDFVLEFSVPGYSKEHFSIKNVDDVLTVKANVEENGDAKESYNRQEFCVQSFERSFTLPDNVDQEKISAKYTNGILHLSVPKKEVVVRDVEVEVPVK